MAMLQVNYFSKAMRREVTFNALIPIDTMGPTGERKYVEKPLKALYLLHGFSGSYTDWISNTNIRQLSDKYNIAIFMPSGENHFYVDDIEKRELFGEYIGDELVQYTRELFPLSEQKEDTFIAGLSMGGYGAIRNGLKYAHHFGGIMALSSALITYKAQVATPDYDDGIGDYNYFTRVFGDLAKLKGSEKDPEALVKKLKATNTDIPNIYMACGTEDFLLDVNRTFKEFLDSENVTFTYVEDAGAHTWEFWSDYIDKALTWAMDFNKEIE
ncbi:alpha/beta hydrolase [Bacillus alkalicellulosilyticus]|uniref:alpha/beta hydrolase n=1 Tax=Alkalihalobacterium alkalicellulosilyticum TaxID=1912214 RepID=UPI00099735C8|nr:alpha/beta hydrolase family protein [Bacillus alkalicellulosilyticus]